MKSSTSVPISHWTLHCSNFVHLVFSIYANKTKMYHDIFGFFYSHTKEDTLESSIHLGRSRVDHLAAVFLYQFDQTWNDEKKIQMMI